MEKKTENKEKEKVDILLATYNTNLEYLELQINSILNQTYPNINLIISDDNSNEEVKNFLKKYETNPKVKIYYQEKNLGYIKNFEFLLNKSTANYIGFSDHDDIWFENKVEYMLNELISSDVSMVYCNCNQINEKNEVIVNNYFKAKNIPIVNGKSTIAISRYIGNGCAQLFTKEVKQECLPYKDSVIAHDWLVSFIANSQKGIKCIENNLFSYRRHTSNVFGGRSLSQNLKIYKKENGSSYSSYLRYRNNNVINKAYLQGAKMCLDYLTNAKTKMQIEIKQTQNIEFLTELINYYEKLIDTKYLYLNIGKYFKYLSYKKMLKQEIKEIAIFHFPLISYIKFLIG